MSSEEIPTLMRMLSVNLLNTINTLELTEMDLKKYFCVSKIKLEPS